MSFVRGDIGISKPRVRLRTVSDGRKAFFADNFGGGTAAVGRKLINAVYSDGKICTVGAPETVAQKANSVAMAENLLYEVGPGTEVGRNEFLCFGRGEMSDTFSPDGKFIKKTITFDKSKDGDSPKEDENDLICFYAALEKKSYLFRIAFSQETAPSRIKIIINDLSGIKRYVQLESPIFNVGTPFASFAFDMPESGNFRICIAPVYENPETDPDECYIAEITRLYLYNMTDAQKHGATYGMLEGADFEGRYYTVSNLKNIEAGRVCASCECGGNLYFATEKCVYRMKNGEVYLLCDSRKGTGGAFYTFGPTVYLTDGDRVLRLSDYSYDVTDEKPTRYTGCEYDASGSLTEKKNPLSLYADAVFGYSPELTRTVPSSIGYGTDYCAVFDGNGNEMPASAYTKEYANGVLTVTLAEAEIGNITVRVRISDKKAEETRTVREAFFGATLFDEGDSKGCKRLMGFSGDKVCIITLTEPFAADADCLSVSAGDTVTALASSGEDRFVFTEKSIKRIVYDGNSLSAVPFKNGFGCDIPESVACYGDGVYFANSYGGIYFIDKDRESSVDVCRRVSATVGREFAAMVSGGKELKAACCDGKYYLFAGDEALVWDSYEKRPSITLSAPDERKLVWYRAKTGETAWIIGSVGDRICYLCAGGIKYLEFASGSGDGSFESEVFYPEGVFAEKRISRVCVSARLGTNAVLRIKLDGERQADTYTLCADEKPTLYTVSVPGRDFYGFSVEISGGDFEIYGVGIEYYI